MKLTEKDLHYIVRESAKRLLKEEEIVNQFRNMPLFKVLDAFKATYGNGATQSLSTESDIIAAMEKIISDNPEKKEEFITRLNGTYGDGTIELDFDSL